MTINAIKSPFPTFLDVDGNPLEDGYIYIGVESQDPEANPLNVYWDEALSELVTQPIRTKGGYPLQSGVPGRIFTGSNYSITVKNKNSFLVKTLASETVLSVYTKAELDGGQLDNRYYTEAEADSLFINNTNEAQAKLGDLDLGQNVAVTSWSYSGTTITVNTTAVHNLSVGDSFYVSGLVADTNAPNGKWTVATVVDTDTITFTASSTPTGSPTVSSAFLVSGITSISATEWSNDGVDIGGGETLSPDGSIVGSNANGDYTKHLNGDLICRAKKEITLGTWTIVGGLASVYYNDRFTFTMPHAFVGTDPSVSYHINENSRASPIWAIGDGTVNTPLTVWEFYPVSSSNGGTGTRKVSLIAIGRWK